VFSLSPPEQLGPGEVPVFDDIQPAARPGQRLCFIPMAQVGRPRTRSRLVPTATTSNTVKLSTVDREKDKAATTKAKPA
jgi:hypothetical protein